MTVSDLTGPGIEPQTLHANSDIFDHYAVTPNARSIQIIIHTTKVECKRGTLREQNHADKTAS